MKDKGIGLLSLIITIITLLIIAGVAIGILCGAESIKETNNNIKTKQINCQHDWVITSKYDWIRESYKTISKCSKCGKEV